MSDTWTEQDDYDRQLYRITVIEQWREHTVAFDRLVRHARALASQMGRTLTPKLRAMERAVHRVGVRHLSAADYRYHRRRCRVCSPHAFPRPLLVDGHEYNRRRRRR